MFYELNPFKVNNLKEIYHHIYPPHRLKPTILEDCKMSVFKDFLHFYISYIYHALCQADGTLNGAPCQGYQPLGHAKDRFTGFR